LFGISISTLMIVSTSLIGDYFEGEQRHRFMGLQSAFISFGGVVFVLGGGILTDINWRYSFGIYLIGIILIPFVAKFLVEKDKSKVKVQDIHVNESLKKVYLLAFLLMLVFYILPTQMPFLMIHNFHTSSTFAGSVISLAFISNALGGITFSKLKNHISFAKIYMLGMMIIALGFISIGFISNKYMFYFSAPVMGFGGGMLMTNTSAWMLSIATQEKRIKASSYLSTMLFMGQFSSPLLFQNFVDFLGVQNFFVAIGVFIASVVSVIFLFRKR
jgi:MFS family permease